MRTRTEKIIVLIAYAFSLAAFLTCRTMEGEKAAILLEDDFSGLTPGMFSAPVGPHTEYHYLPEAAPRGNWAVSCFTWEPGAQRAWWVIEESGGQVMAQSFDSKQMTHTHPMVITGDTLWTDYTATVTFAADSRRDQCGILFRYRNDRCYYFFGLDREKILLKMVRHATDFHKPYENILAAKNFDWETGRYYTAVVELEGILRKEGLPPIEAMQVGA